MSSPLLSAALIVRNEERFLEACLRSLDGLADEIVVVDTGSTDRSLEIARGLGARVSSVVWNGDFSAARNASFDAAHGEWILYIDADERVAAFDRPELERQLASPSHACYTVLFRPQRGFTRYREYRLFRNRPDLRFRGLIHESMLPALEALRAGTGLAVGDSDVCLEHHGYEGDLRNKHERNLPLLQARLEREPLHAYSWSHLGATLLGLGDDVGAEKAWNAGIEVVRSSRSRLPSDSLLYLNLANFLIDRRRDAAALLREGLDFFPDNYSLLWLRGRSLIEAARYAEAFPVFGRIAQVDPATLDGSPLALDESIFGANAHAAMGLCAFRLNRFAASAAHYAQAERLAPGDLGIRSKRQLAEAKAAEITLASNRGL